MVSEFERAYLASVLFGALAVACGSPDTSQQDAALPRARDAALDAASLGTTLDDSVADGSQFGPEDSVPSQLFDSGEPIEVPDASIAPPDAAAHTSSTDAGGASTTAPSVGPVDATSSVNPVRDAGLSPRLDGSAQADAGSSATSSADGQTAPGVTPTAIVGHVRVIPNLAVDGDTLDSTRARTPNDHLDTRNPARDESQLLLKPAWVAGYLGPLPANGAASDGAGDTLDAGLDGSSGLDVVDYYKVRLRRGDTVTLYVEAFGSHETLADNALDAGSRESGAVTTDGGAVGTLPAEVDLDLFLLEPGLASVGDAQWVDDSQGTGKVEQVRAPINGTYWVAVQSYASGASEMPAARYALTVGVPIAPSAQSQISQSKLSTSMLTAAAGVRVKLSEGPATLHVQRELASLGAPESDGRGYRRARLPGSTLVTARERAQESLRWLKQLRRTPGIVSADLVSVYLPQSLEQPNDPEFARQWHHEPIDLQSGWVESQRVAEGEQASVPGLGEGVVVAIVDTGVALDHPDFVNADGTSQLLPGIDMVSDPERARDGDGIDADPTEPPEPGVEGGGMFHGTHCAGNTAAALDNAVGVAGTAPRAKILPVRVLGQTGGDEADIVAGILYAAGLPNASGLLPERKADVINMSLGGAGRSEPIAEAIKSALDSGSIVVASAGNFGAFAEGYSPGGEEGVLTVSAIDARYDLAWYSNYGATSAGIDLAGVGGDTDSDRNFDGYPDGVWSLSHADDGATLYAELAGTSMAAAQVAGVVALMKGAWPAMTASDLMALLPEITVDLGEVGPDPWFGQGLINAAKAVAAARAHAGVDVAPLAVLRSSQLALDFGSLFDSLPLEMTALGSGSVQVNAVTTDAQWVNVSPGDLGVNAVSIDRSFVDQSASELTADVSWESSAGSVSVRVHALPDVSGELGDLGEIEVALLDADSGAVVDRVTATSADGYAFAFEDVAPGAYRVRAHANSLADTANEFGDTASGKLGNYFAEGPFGDHVICKQLERADCGAPLATEDVALSLELDTTLR